MTYMTTGTDKVDRLVGSDEQRYNAATIMDAVEMLREDVRAAFGDAAADEVDDSMLELAGDCVEVKRDQSGAYQIHGDPENWEDVRSQVESIDLVSNEIAGWNGYSHLYHMVDEFGDDRLYFVAV